MVAVKNVHRTLVSEWTDEYINLIFSWSYMGIYMHMVKYGCDFLGPGTLKSALSEE